MRNKRIPSISKDEDTLLQSEDIKSILSTPPKRMLRLGIILIITIIFSFVSIANFIHYPEIISCQIIFNAANLNQNQELSIKLIGQPKNLNAIKAGQKVKIKLDNFGAKEYRVVSGHIINVFPGKNGTYNINVKLTRGFESINSKEYSPDESIVGNLDIIINDLSILDQVSHKIKKIGS